MRRTSLVLALLAAAGCTPGANLPSPATAPAPNRTTAPSTASPTTGTNATPAGPTGAAPTSAAARPDSAQRPGAMRPFGAVTAGTTAKKGFFDTYEKDGALYIAIPKDRFGQDFILNTEVAQGIGSSFVFGGQMLGATVVALERHGDRVFLVSRPIQFTAAPNTGVAKAVDLTFGSSVLDQARIETVRSDSAVLININDWVVSDLSDVGSILRQTLSARPGVPARVAFDRNRSYLDKVKVFPDNMNIRVKLTYQNGENGGPNAVPDYRFVPVMVHYAFARLPEKPMAPRAADDRMGYFLTVRKDFTNDTAGSFFVRYVNRWRLEPGTKVGDLWEPKKPIVYYIDRTIPEAYRPYVKAGVEEWNRAFEAAGWKNAIRAEMLPDSADPEDMRYPTIRWNTSDEPAYGAIGPSITDPRTGEILDADILYEAVSVLNRNTAFKRYVNPAAAVSEMFDASPTELNALSHGAESQSYWNGIAMQGDLLRAALLIDGEIQPGEQLPERFTAQAVKETTMHEVGHTLGLRHNFRSSADTPLNKLRDTTWAKENGVYSSVMEYSSINLWPQGTKAAYFYNPGLGSSDLWVISYGYTADDARAAEIARQGAMRGHAFGTDEDARGAGALDPTVNIFDLSDDPLAWGRERAEMIKGMIPKLPSRILADNGRYADLTGAFGSLVGQYSQALATGVKYIGGQYQYRDHVGDPNGRPPFVNVPKAKQQEALDFLTSYAFGEKAFDFPREVLQQLGANRWSHWGEQNTINGRIDYPLHEQVLGAQQTLVDQVMNPFVFARIRDAETKFGADQVLSIPEFVNGITTGIWSEVYSGARNISANRRDLQRLYIDRMGQLVLGDTPRLPADARAVARAQLVSLKSRMDAVRTSASLDAYTKAHLSESSARIGKLLDAGLDAK